MRVIPPIKAIIYFEAAARLQSFKLAADELCVTPGAVSHQIQTLEQFIGQPLFQRQNRSIKLTNVGLRYFNRTFLILNDLEQATTDLGLPTKNQKINILIPPTLLNKWLLPKLNMPALAAQGISLSFLDTLDNLDLHKADIDIAILYSLEAPKNHSSQYLFDEEMIAVCSPNYLSTDELALTSSAFNQVTLIETTNRLIQWDLVFHHHKIKIAADQHKLYFQNSIQSIEAATQGLGIAFINRLLVQSLLNEGKLITLDNICYRPDKQPAYYLTATHESLQNSAVASLYQTIIELALTTA